MVTGAMQQCSTFTSSLMCLNQNQILKKNWPHVHWHFTRNLTQLQVCALVFFQI